MYSQINMGSCCGCCSEYECCSCCEDEEQAHYVYLQNVQQREDELLMKIGTPLREFIVKWGNPNVLQTRESGFKARENQENIFLMSGHAHITKRLEYSHFTAYVKQLNYIYDNRGQEYVFKVIPYPMIQSHQSLMT